jgi:hypothetical protein
MMNAGGPTIPGARYRTEVVVDSITVGAVMMIVGGTASEPVTTPGIHKLDVTAAIEQQLGVFGEYTDAVIDRVSVRPIA